MIDPEEFLQRHPPVVQAGLRQQTDEAVQADGQTGTDTRTDVQECFDAAVSSLSAADATVFMLRRRLRGKDYPDEVIDEVIPRLEHAGLLDDEQFASDLLQRCLRRNMGPAGIRREFLRRGLSSRLADTLIGQAQEEGRFDDAARAFVEAFARKSGGLDRQTLLRRLASRAASRGLPMGLVRRYAAEILDI
jgi:regulatory protein